MTKSVRLLLPAGLLCLTLCGCGAEPRDFLPTYPVSGRVLVDGAPAGDLLVKAQNVKGMDREHPTVTAATTDSEGKFVLTTYKAGDGAPAGEYALTFMWGQTGARGYGGPDRLNGRYSSPEQSQAKFTVTNGPVEVGDINLATR